MHFAASTHNFLILEYHPDDAGSRAELLQRPMQLKDGYLEIPEAPGLGIELNEDAIPKRPTRNWRRGSPTRPDGAAAFI